MRANHYILFAQKVILLLTIILSLSASLPAEDQNIQFQHITNGDGLSQTTVQCIIQDRKGFMWLGTRDGLNRYDGNEFRHFKPSINDPQSLSNNSIQAIYEDRSGILWIGTFKGLNKFDREKGNFTHYLNVPEDPRSLSHDGIRAICEDHLGNLWIGTSGGGLDIFDRDNERFSHHRAEANNPQSLSSNIVNSLYEDHAGVLWVGTDSGLNRFNQEKGIFTRYQYDPHDPNSLSSDTVLSLYEDHTGALWVGTDSGLNRYDREKNRFIRYKNDPNNPDSLSSDTVFSIYEDHTGALWVGTYSGLNRYDREKNRFIRYKNDPNNPDSLSDNEIIAIYEDRSGMLWIGTYYEGLNLFDRNRKKFILYKLSNKPPSRCFYKDASGVLWVGTDGEGLYKLDRPNNNIRLYKHERYNPYSLSNNSVFSIIEDRSGVLWVGTYGGLNRFDRVKEKFIHYQHDSKDLASLSYNKIRSLYEDRSGVLWVGTYGGGLNKFDRVKERFTRYQNNSHDPNSLSNNNIWSICEDRSGVLWVGTYGGGLDKFDRVKERFTRYQNNSHDPSSLSSDYILCIKEGSDGTLWIGTEGGLNRYDPEKNSFVHYREEEGFVNNVIYGILEDESGNLWLSHNKGLARFDPQKQTFRNYDVKDGLQSNEFNGGAYYKSRNGEMFFGGTSGFNAFFPHEIKDNPYLPPVVITNFQTFNKPVPIGKTSEGRIILKKSITETESIELSFKDRVLSFEFAALNYVSPEKNQYAYIMQGFEKDWNYVGNRHFASYTNLPPGQYIFRVKGSNNDGIWNEQGASLRIRITPPFWKRWWFYLICISFVTSLGLGMYQYRISQLKRHEEVLEKLVVERTHQLREANQKLELLATTDGLTGIANYRRFREFLHLEWRRAIRYRNPISIIMVDVDDFKPYNDTYGHQAGDECLQKIASVLIENCGRPGDLSARYGGEEFIIILSDTNASGALHEAEQIRASVASLKIPHEKSRAADYITISLGCATAFPKQGSIPDSLISAADQALYESKKSGRNRTSVADLSSKK
jgi:diguanylate cyclase (GGDEF)-like protein